MPFDVFISYSHKDKALRDELAAHLSNLRNQGLINDWYDGDISPGTEWKQQITDHLSTAKIFLLLISADFMASHFCYSIEMQQAIARHNTNQARVLPIILRPTDWEGAPFAKLLALPIDGTPVTNWPNRDQAFLDIIRGIRRAIEELNRPHFTPSSPVKSTFTMPRTIEFAVEPGDITLFDADVVALKHAQEFYGADLDVASRLDVVGIPIGTLSPHEGDSRYVETLGCIRAPHALFVGTPSPRYFGYQEIRQFAAAVLHILANVAPNTRHLAMTIHGVGFGLDEIEAVHAQLAGYLDAISSGLLPTALSSITIIDRNAARVERLRQALEKSLSQTNYATRILGRWAYHLTPRPQNNTFGKSPGTSGAIEEAGKASKTKAHAFVAMPFSKEMDDVFYFGIQQPVRSAGLLCERIDQDAFIGDILDQVKGKIETAAVVIADLSGANPNVYLEVGYAWGKGRPTLLLVKSEQELRFDVRGQRCLKYESIKNLADVLSRELRELQDKKIIGPR